MKKLIIIFIYSLSFVSAQNNPLKTYYENGNLKSEINYSDSVREGEAKFYFENGNLKEKLNYVNGKVNGLVEIYDEDGDMIEMYNVQDGKREGPASLFDSSGTYLSDINFENGKLIIKTETPGETPEAAEDIAETNPQKNNLPPLVEENLESDPAYYLTPEVMPEPVVGMDSLLKRLYYPSLAKIKKIEGTVKILAYITKDGQVTRAEVKEGIGFGCDETARNLIYYSRFKPGLIRGKPVNVQMIIPVEFKLKSNKKD